MTFRKWHTISTAPKDGTMIELMSDRRPGVQHCMTWDGVRWAGLAFTPLGTREVYWEPDDPPTHWRPIE
jgi:hypothetical protein